MSEDSVSVDQDPIICLECGGVVVEHAPPPEGLSALREDVPRGYPRGAEACHCHLAEPASAKSIRCPACGGSLKLGARACPYCHSVVATKRCGDCLAWNLADAKHCQECASTSFASDPESPEKTGHSCPRCTGSLSARRYADLRAAECDSCGGIMLDVEMMNKVVSARDHSLALRLALPKRESKRETEVHYLTCPVCKKSMNRKAFGRISGVVVDVCKTDGVWFDAGELADVLAFVERGGLEEARKRELDDLHESKRAANAAAIQAAALDTGHSHSAETARSGLSSELAIGREVLSALASLWS